MVSNSAPGWSSRARTALHAVLLAALVTFELVATSAASVDGTWTQLPPIVPRATAYDPIGDRVIAFSNSGWVFVWERPAGEFSDWSMLQPLGEGPFDPPNDYTPEAWMEYASTMRRTTASLSSRGYGNVFPLEREDRRRGFQSKDLAHALAVDQPKTTCPHRRNWS